ncbi:cupin domain-containing protein [Glycomyces sp. NPDC049804]|uniref:cupin domain-containing protein n=1 Tax=Glycomyces sp. NPDC049804 TaxID=3154363 RepID=UPI0034377E08
MPKTSKAEAAETISDQGFEGHYTELDTGYTIGFEAYTADADLTEFFKGLPDDRCQCPHWGYVFKGKVTYKTADGDETFTTGDAYHVGPGHTPVIYKDTELVEFSPTEELQQTIDVVMKNMKAAG